MAWRRWQRAVGTLLVSGLLAGGSAAVAAAETTVAFRITDRRVTGVSGMAADPQANLYWMVNDSGGVVYGVNRKGKVRGTLRYRADPVSVEAVALHQDRLYVADIGDNAEKRRKVTVYYFDQPRASGLTVSYRAWDFRYPDGAHHAQTLLVTRDGRLSIVTKGAKGGLYRASKNPSTSKTNTLTRVHDAPPFVTDGVVLPGGRQLALLSDNRVLIVDAETGEQQASAPVTGQQRAESMALGLDRTSLLVASAGKKPTVVRIAIPGPTAGPSTAPQDPGGGEEADVTDLTAAPNRRGTLLALGLAGLVAVVAGVVTAVVRRP